jgi:hypothetical protein
LATLLQLLWTREKRNRKYTRLLSWAALAIHLSRNQFVNGRFAAKSSSTRKIPQSNALFPIATTQ